MIKLEIKIDQKDLDRMAAKMDAIQQRDTLNRALTAGGLFLSTWIIKNRLSGPRPKVLGRVTSRLATSIGLFNLRTDKGDASVRIGTNVEYAAIHEKGGVIHPGAKGFLAWKDRDSGEWIFTKKPVHIPARPFLKPAVENEENIKTVTKIIGDKIHEAVENA